MCEYVALRPSPNARPNGSIPATSSRSSHRNASTLRHPGPRALPPRPVTADHHPAPAVSAALAPSPGSLAAPLAVLCAVLPSLLLPFSLLLFLSFRLSGLVSLDHFA